MEQNRNFRSELREILSSHEFFQDVYEDFLNQADENFKSKSKPSNGPKCPIRLKSSSHARSGKLKVDGRDLGQQFGQGHASSFPYFNWDMVSIYYIPQRKRIILGIEANEERYFSLSKQLRDALPTHKLDEIVSEGKHKKVAIFDEYSRDSIDYQKLYDNFIYLCEFLMQNGVV